MALERVINYFCFRRHTVTQTKWHAAEHRANMNVSEHIYEKMTIAVTLTHNSLRWIIPVMYFQTLIEGDTGRNKLC